MIVSDIALAFWFFLPAGLANMFPVFAARLPVIRRWEYPMDFHFNIRGKRVLGPHKTMRGLMTGIIVGVAIVWIQKKLYLNYESVRGFSVDYSAISPIYLGALLGLGAILGDAVKSFFKRQANIASGESWLFFDQIDYIIGGIVFTYWYAPLTPVQYVYLVLIYFVLHFVVNGAGYMLGLKRAPI